MPAWASRLNDCRSRRHLSERHQRHDVVCVRRRGCGWSIRHTIRKGQGREYHHNHFLGRKPRPPRKPAPTPLSTINARTSVSGRWTSPESARRRHREMDLTANAKLIPAVLRPKGSVIIYGTGAGTSAGGLCLVNSICLQFFLVYELDAAERERALSAINDALGQATYSIGPRTRRMRLGRYRGCSRSGRARYARQRHRKST